MRIVVNTRYLLKHHTGGFGKFTYETFKRLTCAHPEAGFVFLFDRPFSDEYVFSGNITPKVIGLPARHPLLWYRWNEWSVPAELKKYKPDIYLSPDGSVPLHSNVKSIAVIHDLNFVHFPHFIPLAERIFFRHYFPRYAAKAGRLITVSEFSKNDLMNTYGIKEDKIDVAYNAAGQEYCPLEEDRKKEIREHYTDGCEYFIFVGGLYPRKNIRNLLLAFDEFKKATGSNFFLVLVGARIRWGTDWQYVYERMEYKKFVRFIPHQEPAGLAAFYAAAFALVFPSYFEGFGIPIVEAMSCEIPVITSRTSSMPEVTGDAALLVDPFSVDSISGTMIKLYRNKELYNSLVEKSRIRKLKFSWDNTARVVWKSIEKALAG